MDANHRQARAGADGRKRHAARPALTGASLDLPDWNEALKAPAAGLEHGFARTPAKSSNLQGPPQVLSFLQSQVQE